MTKRLLALVNPISGGKNKLNAIEQLRSNLHNQFSLQLETTKSKDHTIALAKDAVLSGFDAVVALGGDGTINDIASVLIGSNTALAIIPVGSGNGFANALHISHQVQQAINIINKFNVTVIDTATVNNIPFVNIAGTGFDAHIGQLFSTAGSRGLITYAKITLKELWHYRANEIQLVQPESENLIIPAFLATVCNGTQFGNNAFIAPNALLNDGFLNLTIIKKMPMYAYLPFMFRLFNQSVLTSKYVYHAKAKSFEIIRPAEGPVNIDGEPFNLGQKLTFEIKPNSLKVIAQP